MYADSITYSMQRAITETSRRRKKQDEYNKAHGIIPTTVTKEIRDVLDITVKEKDKNGKPKKLSAADTEKLEKELIEFYRSEEENRTENTSHESTSGESTSSESTLYDKTDNADKITQF